MVDEKTADYVSKDDLKAFIASFEQKMADKETAFKKELEVKENAIHASYAKKLKKLGLDEASQDEDSPDRKPTKREMELQSNVEKLVKRLEEGETRTKMAERRSSVQDQLIKSGINPKAVNTVYDLLNARQVFVEGEDGMLRMKVDAEGIGGVALPVSDALKHFTKSDEGQLFLAPKMTGGGSGAKNTTPSSVSNGTSGDEKKPFNPYGNLEVDWAAIGREQFLKTVPNT
jgi:hypothetical protein